MVSSVSVLSRQDAACRKAACTLRTQRSTGSSSSRTAGDNLEPTLELRSAEAAAAAAASGDRRCQETLDSLALGQNTANGVRVWEAAHVFEAEASVASRTWQGGMLRSRL